MEHTVIHDEKVVSKYLNRDKSPICNMMKRTEFWISFIQ